MHITIENLTALTHVQWQLVAVLLTIGYGAHLAFSIYFAAASTQIAPRYRLVPWFSAVIMLAAGLNLLREFSTFDGAFTWNGQVWEPIGNRVFDNAYRYANWLITIPLLLSQLLIALNLPRPDRHRRFTLLTIAAVLMILTGLAGQFLEAGNVTGMLIWGFISTIPFVYVVWAVKKALVDSEAHTPAVLHGWTRNLFWYFLFFWGLYALAYMIPAVDQGGWGIVTRQGMYTAADIFSKLVYGVILSRFVLRRSALEGYAPAVEALSPWPEEVAGGTARPRTRGGRTSV